jgi:hypothetical protein
VIFGTLLLFPGASLWAAAGADKGDKAPRWNKGVDYLESLLESRDAAFDSQKVAELLDFVVSPQGADAHLDPGKRDNATGAYFYTDIKAPLAKVLKYAYNPAIPAYVTLPSVVRLGGWQAKPTGPFETLWEKAGSVTEPLVVRGVEYEEITPDLSTGSYYRYDMDRFMVLLSHKGRDFFISVAGQKSPSTVGRKGAIIGPDADWTYYYSGQKGLSKSGLGWVSSYMYDAASVSILYEPVPSKGQTRYVTFKWLRAGWGGINMVGRENILEGCRRFAMGFKKILESPNLPEADQLAGLHARIKSLADQDLNAWLQPVGKALKALCRTEPSLSRSDFQDQIESGKYLASMNREEKENLLMTESVKLSIGKKSFLDRIP